MKKPHREVTSEIRERIATVCGKMRQKYISDYTGLSQGTISRLLRGKSNSKNQFAVDTFIGLKKLPLPPETQGEWISWLDKIINKEDNSELTDSDVDEATGATLIKYAARHLLIASRDETLLKRLQAIVGRLRKEPSGKLVRCDVARSLEDAQEHIVTMLLALLETNVLSDLSLRSAESRPLAPIAVFFGRPLPYPRAPCRAAV